MVCNRTRDKQNRCESDFLITSMITERIGEHEVLLPINQNYEKIEKKKKTLEIFPPPPKKKKKKKKNMAKCKTTVQLQAWRVYCPISAQVGLVIANHVWEFCYSFG